MGHKKYDTEFSDTILTYNNPVDQVLNICIDNFETFGVVVKLDVKTDHKLGNTDSVPDFS